MSAFPGILMAANGNSPFQLVKLEQNLHWQSPPGYELGMIATMSPGASLTYTVQVTGDQVPSNNGNWNAHDVLVGQTASANSNVAYAISAYRLNVTNYVSGSVNLGVAKWP
jgi:hypothetical protein